MSDGYTPPLTAQDFNMAQNSQVMDDLYKSDMIRLADTLLNDQIVDTKLQNFPLWSTMSRSMKLSFFTGNDVASLEHLFEAEVCRLMRRLPPTEQNYNTYSMIAQARMIFKANIRRSLGMTQGTLNERLAILTQLKMMTPVSSMIEMPHQQKRGFWGKLTGR
jgi:hypothetical protein